METKDREAKEMARQLFDKLNSLYEARLRIDGEDAAHDAVVAAWQENIETVRSLTKLSGLPLEEQAVSRESSDGGSGRSFSNDGMEEWWGLSSGESLTLLDHGVYHTYSGSLH